MGIFSVLFDRKDSHDSPELLPAIERAVSQVDPNLRTVHGYPDKYRKCVGNALDYVRNLASALPDPVAVSRRAFALDPLVHALFPDPDSVSATFRESRAMIDFQKKNPGIHEFYALMGMRRREKTLIGCELAGNMVSNEAMHKVVYFTSHTIENPAQSEQQSRELIALSFFDRLVSAVAKQVALRREAMHALSREKDLLTVELRLADQETRASLEQSLENIVNEMQKSAASLDLRHHIEDFESVLLNPGHYLELNRTELILDDMGIRRQEEDAIHGKQIIFNDLLGFDRRRWTVTLIHCSKMEFDDAGTITFPRSLAI